MNKAHLPKSIKPIPGYPGYYVSTHGKVYSDFIRGNGSRHGDTLKRKSSVLRKNGYVKVDLSVGGIKVTRNIHKLVAITHIPNPLKLPLINHRDFIKSHNYVDNLEWCTQKHNIEYNVIHGHTTMGIKNAMAKLTEEKVREIREYHESHKVTYQTLSKMYGINYHRISKIIRGKLWKVTK